MPNSSISRECPNCGVTFQVTKSWKRFCTGKCKNLSRSKAVTRATEAFQLIARLSKSHSHLRDHLKHAAGLFSQLSSELEEIKSLQTQISDLIVSSLKANPPNTDDHQEAIGGCS
jgi:hypothetical protein